MSRIYVPADAAFLEKLKEAGSVALEEPVYLVTEALREAFPDADGEDLEYTAFAEAAGVSAGMATAERPRRVVVSADLPDKFLEEIPGTAAAEASGSVKLAKVAAIHVDDDEAAGAVKEGIEKGSLDPEGLESLVMDWYHPSELDSVLEIFALGISRP
ncbi:DUF6912 family protein [Salininema proteolyticum]|uniref:DUF6912 family protein n=1 Tax=Salininema proteolyticum TaxID=1607685 RepID=A0ABV8TX05_9ACTN